MAFEAAFAGLPSCVAEALRAAGGAAPSVFVHMVDDLDAAMDLLGGIEGEYDVDATAGDLVALSVLARAPAKAALRTMVAATGLDVTIAMAKAKAVEVPHALPRAVGVPPVGAVQGLKRGSPGPVPKWPAKVRRAELGPEFSAALDANEAAHAEDCRLSCEHFYCGDASTPVSPGSAA